MVWLGSARNRHPRRTVNAMGLFDEILDMVRSVVVPVSQALLGEDADGDDDTIGPCTGPGTCNGGD